MSCFVTADRQDELLRELKKTYRVFAPRAFARHGWGEENQVIRYGEIDSFSQLVWDRKSDFSPKEVFYPIVQTLLYFTADECRESELTDQREILLFARACDINGIRRLDTMFLKNGGHADNFYARLREKLHLILLECTESFETCFCVSMGTNVAEDYAAAMRFTPLGICVSVKEAALEPYFAGMPETAYVPEFVQENAHKVRVPQIPDRSMLPDIVGLDYWKQFNDRCISCGGCNTVCITCSCFDTTDIIYDETSRDGERRRAWGSCMLADFTTMAGGHGVRPTAGDRMRFKTLHKIYDFKLRFGEENMCVGCGRCDMRCPKDIHFSETVDGLAAEVEKLCAQGKEADGK